MDSSHGPLTREGDRASRRAWTQALLVPLVLSGLWTGSLAAQEADFLRVGITYGSLSRFGLSVEYVWDQTGAELIVGTRSFEDVIVSAVAKQYLGEGLARGYVGVGLTGATEWSEGGVATGLLLRAPLGLELRPSGPNWFGLDISVHRALVVNRADPEDQRPPRAFPIPLPGFYWKYGHRRAGTGY